MTTIVIDAIFFQINEWSGIAKQWRNLLAKIDTYLEQNQQENIRVFLLLRGDSETLRSAQYKQIQKLPICVFDYRSALSDFEHLGHLCRELGTTAFISSYYTLAYDVPNIGMSYDFIPEHLNVIHTHHSWVAKALYMKSLSCTLVNSKSTARDASLFYPNLDPAGENVFYPPIEASEFRLIEPKELGSFRSRYSLHFPYIAIIGNRTNYKNVGLLTSALERRDPYQRPLPLGVVMTSGEELSRDEINLYAKHFTFGLHRFNLRPDELTCLLHEAEMLFYPSLLEGFGYPIVEAMAQGCPVITTGSTSIPEILRHTEHDDVRIISGYDPEEALRAIVSLLHGRRRVGADTIARLKEAFGRDESGRFLGRIQELARTARPPLDDYLPACLSLDGLLA
jgi:glycosyltransferase involved in cell wall biosynthesis